jgi:hypothetical protein
MFSRYCFCRGPDIIRASQLHIERSGERMMTKSKLDTAISPEGDSAMVAETQEYEWAEYNLPAALLLRMANLIDQDSLAFVGLPMECQGEQEGGGQ